MTALPGTILRSAFCGHMPAGQCGGRYRVMYLKEFKESALGHALIDGEVPPEMKRLGLDRVAGRWRAGAGD